jgi:hypothetical protein
VGARVDGRALYAALTLVPLAVEEGGGEVDDFGACSRSMRSISSSAKRFSILRSRVAAVTL